MEEKLIIALIGGTTGAIIGFITSYVTTKVKITQELKTWNSDFAVNYSKLLLENPAAASLLARQFSVALIIVRDEQGRTESKHFIPYQCKISVGRNADNDIVLSDQTVSRHHGIFFYRGSKIKFQELSPLNMTLLNNKPIQKICRLKSGDKITLGKTVLEFEKL